MRILANDGIAKDAEEYFKNKGIEVSTTHLDLPELLEEGPKYDVLVVRSKTKVTEEVAEALGAGVTKLVIRGGVGLDNIDIPACNARGIEVRNTPNSSKHAVAELVLGQMINMARHVDRADESMKAGEWKKDAFKGTELRGSTLGIVGYGRIGRCLAEKARALGMNVLFFDPFCDGDNCAVGTPLEELLEQSDFVSLHTPSMEKPLINRDTLPLMRGSYLINLSRGNTVDEEALIEALKDGTLKGAALDVFQSEPKVNEAFFTLDNVHLTPHIGAATAEAQVNIGKEIIELVEELMEVEG